MVAGRATVRLRMAVAAVACLAFGAIGGCGGVAPREASRQDYAKARAELRMTCLEAREGGAIAPAVEISCARVGVTSTSPPRDTDQAEVAAGLSRRQGRRLERETGERPVYEKQARSSALLSLSQDHVAAARSSLTEGCPKADPDQLATAWAELRRLAQSPPSRVSTLEADLEDICPL